MIKKITNWTFGGFFRTVGRFLFYILIGLLITLIVSKKELVNAATITPSSTTYMSLWCDDIFCPYTEGGSTTSSGWISRNTAYANPAGRLPGYYLTHIKFRTQLNSSNYLQVNNQYVVQIRWNMNPRYDYTTYYPNEWVYVLNITHSDNTYSDDNNLSASCQKYSGDSYGVVCSFTIQPTKPVKEFTFRILFPYYQYSIFTQLEGVNYKTISITGNTDTTDAINNQTIIIGGKIDEINDSITSESNDVESSSCGVICKLKNIWNILKPSSIVNLIVPSEEQMGQVMEDIQDLVTNKLGILGLPISVYTTIMNLIANVSENENWCINWEGVKVPNFESFTIIPAGSYCFNTLLQNEKINNLRNFSLYFTGALILLSFMQYLRNMLNRVLDVPDRDDYTYFTTEEVYNVDTKTGEVSDTYQMKQRSTYRKKV